MSSSGFNYALDSYALSCCEVSYFLLHPAYADRHMSMANDVNRSCCERFTHGIIWLLEVIPVIGTIAALFEVIIVKAGGHKNREGTVAPAPMPQPVDTRVPSTPTPKQSTPKPAAPNPRVTAVDTAASPVLTPASRLKPPPPSALLTSPPPAASGNFANFFKSYVPAFAREAEDGKAEASGAKAQQKAIQRAFQSNPDNALKKLLALGDSYDATYHALNEFQKTHPHLRKNAVSSDAPPPPASKGPPPPPPLKGKGPPVPPPLKGASKGSTQIGGTKADQASQEQQDAYTLAELELAHKPNQEALKAYLLEGYGPEELAGLNFNHPELCQLARKFRDIATQKASEKKDRAPATPISSPVASPKPATPELTGVPLAFMKALNEIGGIINEYEKCKKECAGLIENCRRVLGKMPKTGEMPPALVQEFNGYTGDLMKLGPKMQLEANKLDRLESSKTKYWPELNEKLKAERKLMTQAIGAVEVVNIKTNFATLSPHLAESNLLAEIREKMSEVQEGRWKEPKSQKNLSLSRKGLSSSPSSSGK